MFFIFFFLFFIYSANSYKDEGFMDISNPNHQVFVCFHTSDVHDNVFSFIKDRLIEKGVNVRTDEDAPRGKLISENLLNLIRVSKVAVVIFSKNFPSSEWCLDELVEIKKQMDQKKLEPLPLFFEVEIKHVQLKEHNPFKDLLLRLEDTEREKARKESKKALEEAEKRFLSWREALIFITGFTGLTYKKDSTQAIFVRGVVDEVKKMLANVPSSDGVLQHQVFISFHGRDIKNHFLPFLAQGLKRSGINVYTDVENLIAGEDIDKLFIGIQESRIAIVIFTENYMSSDWCLEELVEIHKYMRMGGLVAIPIFYGMEPHDVVRDNERFFEQLVEIWGATDARINRWNEALKSVGMISGLTSTLHKTDAVLVENIIQETKRVLDNTSSNEIEFPCLALTRSS